MLECITLAWHRVQSLQTEMDIRSIINHHCIPIHLRTMSRNGIVHRSCLISGMINVYFLHACCPEAHYGSSDQSRPRQIVRMGINAQTSCLLKVCVGGRGGGGEGGLQPDSLTLLSLGAELVGCRVYLDSTQLGSPWGHYCVVATGDIEMLLPLRHSDVVPTGDIASRGAACSGILHNWARG